VTAQRSNAAAQPGARELAGRPIRVPDQAELPPLVPRTALAVIDEAVTFLRIEPGLLFGTALIVLVPMRVMALAFPGSPLRDARPDQLLDIFIANTSAPGAVVAAFATLILESIALFAVAAIYGQVLADWYSERAATASDLLVASVKRSPLLFIGWLMVHVVEGLVATFTVMLGVLIIGPLLMIVAPVMGAENSGPFAAMKRSSSLASPRLVHCAFVFVMSGIAALVIRTAIRFLPSLVGLELLNLPLWAVSGVADVIASVVVTAFVAAVSTILYLDLRVRREGIDLDMAMTLAFAPRSGRDRTR
jgi:hypothetical protein